MLRTSPTSMLEYLLKFPPFDNIARPIATEHDENTEIIVSVDAIFMLPILLRSSAKMIAKITIDKDVSPTPNTTPTAIPVNAECPSASEKYAIFLLTIIVPIIPNKGVIMSTAIRAFLIKSKLNQEAIFIFLPPLLSRNLLLLKKSAQIQDFHILPLRFPVLLLFYREGPHDLHTLPHNQGHVI